MKKKIALIENPCIVKSKNSHTGDERGPCTGTENTCNGALHWYRKHLQRRRKETLGARDIFALVEKTLALVARETLALVKKALIVTETLALLETEAVALVARETLALLHQNKKQKNLHVRREKPLHCWTQK